MLRSRIRAVSPSGLRIYQISVLLLVGSRIRAALPSELRICVYWCVLVRLAGIARGQCYGRAVALLRHSGLRIYR